MVLPVEVLVTSYWDASKPWRETVVGTRRVPASLKRREWVCASGDSWGTQS